MKSPRIVSLCFWTTAACLCLGLASFARATTNTNATAAASAAKTNAVATATNSAAAEMPIPVSAFDLTLKPTKDPFYPLSLRPPIPVATNAAPLFSSGNFVLKGLSGSSDRRLALVNNRTIAAGENAEITTPSGKIKIHCVEVKEMSVVIRAESQPDSIEIFLRKSLQ